MVSELATRECVARIVCETLQAVQYCSFEVAWQLSCSSCAVGTMQWDLLTQNASSSPIEDGEQIKAKVALILFDACCAMRTDSFVFPSQAPGISPNMSTARTDDELGDKLHRDQGKHVSTLDADKASKSLISRHVSVKLHVTILLLAP